MESGMNVKVGVSYNLFDGEELLPASIKAIRDKVHYINVVYQKISYLGNQASPNIEEKLQGMVKEGLIDELYLYEPILEIPARYNELAKRDIGLILAKHNSCDYFLSMDVDEFYDGTQFEEALKVIVDNNITTTAVNFTNYLKSPEYQIYGISGQVPFLIKIDRSIEQKHGRMYFPCFVDPTRKLNCPGRFWMFSPQHIVMHHMTTVRKDLLKKFGNTSETDTSKQPVKKLKLMQKSILDFNFDDCREFLQDFAISDGRVIRKVENNFNIKMEELCSQSKSY
jgi:hypothetical protein